MWSATRIMITLAALAASAVVITLRPAAAAFSLRSVYDLPCLIVLLLETVAGFGKVEDHCDEDAEDLEVVVLTTDPNTLVVGLVRLRVPYTGAFVFSSALRFLPLVLGEAAALNAISSSSLP